MATSTSLRSARGEAKRNATEQLNGTAFWSQCEPPPPVANFVTRDASRAVSGGAEDDNAHAAKLLASLSAVEFAQAAVPVGREEAHD